MALHILVVDDDVDVLPVLVESLRISGFVVTSASSGIAMRENVVGGSLAVDAVVLDCVMAGEPAAQLALHAKAIIPYLTDHASAFYHAWRQAGAVPRPEC